MSKSKSQFLHISSRRIVIGVIGLIIVCSFVVIIRSLLSQSKTSNTESISTNNSESYRLVEHTDPQGRYSFSAPDTWNVKKLPDSKAGFAISPKKKSSEIIYVNVFENSKNLSIQDLFETFDDTSSLWFAKYPHEPQTINGLSAVRFKPFQEDSNQPQRVEVAIKGDQLVGILSHQYQDDDSSAAFERIVQSYKLLPYSAGAILDYLKPASSKTYKGEQTIDFADLRDDFNTPFERSQYHGTMNKYGILFWKKGPTASKKLSDREGSFDYESGIEPDFRWFDFQSKKFVVLPIAVWLTSSQRFYRVMNIYPSTTEPKVVIEVGEYDTESADFEPGFADEQPTKSHGLTYNVVTNTFESTDWLLVYLSTIKQRMTVSAGYGFGFYWDSAANIAVAIPGGEGCGPSDTLMVVDLVSKTKHLIEPGSNKENNFLVIKNSCGPRNMVSPDGMWFGLYGETVDHQWKYVLYQAKTGSRLVAIAQTSFTHLEDYPKTWDTSGPLPVITLQRGEEIHFFKVDESGNLPLRYIDQAAGVSFMYPYDWVITSKPVSGGSFETPGSRHSLVIEPKKNTLDFPPAGRCAIQVFPRDPESESDWISNSPIYKDSGLMITKRTDREIVDFLAGEDVTEGGENGQVSKSFYYYSRDGSSIVRFGYYQSVDVSSIQDFKSFSSTCATILSTFERH